MAHQRSAAVRKAALVGRLQQAQRAPDHVGVVAGGAGRLGLAGAPGMGEPAVLLHVLHDEAEGGGGGLQPLGAVEHARGVGERGDHQPVPVGQHLVVPAGANAARAARQQLAAHVRQGLLLGGRAQQRIAQAVEDGVAFPVAGFRHVVGLREHLGIGLAQHLDDLGLAPDVELALLALGIGVERGGEASAFGDHLAQQPADRLVDAARVELVAGLAVGLAHEVDQQRVVVEHLLEVRDEPALVDRVAREAAAQVVVDAALADAGERGVDGLLGSLVAVADGAAPQQPEEAPLRELRRPREAAMDRVDGADHAAREVGQHAVLDQRPWPCRSSRALRASTSMPALWVTLSRSSA